jgi:hypothetical protein
MQPARSASISKVLPQPIPLLLKERHKTMECVHPARPASTKELLPQHLAFLVPQVTTPALSCHLHVQLALWENILLPLKQPPVRFVLLVLTTMRMLQLLPAFLVPKDTTPTLPCHPDVQLALWENILVPLKQLPVRFVLLVHTTIRVLQILPAFLVPKDTTPTLPCHLSAMVAELEPMLLPMKQFTVTHAVLVHITMKLLQPPNAKFVQLDNIKTTLAAPRANFAQLAKHWSRLKRRNTTMHSPIAKIVGFFNSILLKAMPKHVTCV